jgi:hypothetical protein
MEGYFLASCLSSRSKGGVGTMLKLIQELIKGFGSGFSFFVFVDKIDGFVQVGEDLLLFGGELLGFDHFHELQAFKQFLQEGKLAFVFDIEDQLFHAAVVV